MPLFDTPTIPSCVFTCSYNHVTSQVVLEVKNPPADAGDTEDVGLLPGLGQAHPEGPLFPQLLIGLVRPGPSDCFSCHLHKDGNGCQALALHDLVSANLSSQFSGWGGKCSCGGSAEEFAFSSKGSRPALEVPSTGLRLPRELWDTTLLIPVSRQSMRHF